MRDRENNGRFIKGHKSFNSKVVLTKEELIDLYTIKEISSNDIGRNFGISSSSVLHQLEKYGIPIRKKVTYNTKIKISNKNKGKVFSLETREKISKSLKGKKLSEERKEKIKESIRKVTKTEDWLNKRKESQLKLWQNSEYKKRMSILHKGQHNSPKTEFKKGNTPWWIQKGLDHPLKSPLILKKALQIQIPNKSEIKLNNIIQDNFPSDWLFNAKTKDIIIEGKVPDWFNINGEKKVIELFGDYWHNPNKNNNVKEERTKRYTLDHYNKYGYSCLVIEEKELKNENEIINKIKEWGILEDIKQ